MFTRTLWSDCSFKWQLDEVEPQNFNLFSFLERPLRQPLGFSNYDFSLSHQNEIDVPKPKICFDPSFMLKIVMALFLEGSKILVKYNTWLVGHGGPQEWSNPCHWINHGLHFQTNRCIDRMGEWHIVIYSTRCRVD